MFVVQKEGYVLDHLNVIFCSDRYLHRHNITYLQHDTLTDVITFDYATVPQSVLADIYISIERVKENATVYRKDTQEELRLVLVHGLLHVLGYNDQQAEEKAMMHAKELEYLQWLANF